MRREHSESADQCRLQYDLIHHCLANDLLHCQPSDLPTSANSHSLLPLRLLLAWPVAVCYRRPSTPTYQRQHLTLVADRQTRPFSDDDMAINCFHDPTNIKGCFQLKGKETITQVETPRQVKPHMIISF